MRRNEKVNRLRMALEAVLLFHEGGEWDHARSAAWKIITGKEEATTAVLCNTVRAALDEAEWTHTSDGQEVPPLPGAVQKR